MLPRLYIKAIVGETIHNFQRGGVEKRGKSLVIGIVQQSRVESSSAVRYRSPPRAKATRKDSMKQCQEARRGHLLSGASARHDTPVPIAKGCAAFLVGVEEETPRRFAVPVALLGHPRILELLMEAKEEYDYTYEGAIVVPCSAERFQDAVDAARGKEQQHHHHHHFRLPHLAGCFRPSHVVS